jgi:hypothetical protein
LRKHYRRSRQDSDCRTNKQKDKKIMMMMVRRRRRKKQNNKEKPRRQQNCIKVDVKMLTRVWSFLLWKNES